jgi:stage II sporulation protein AA (anti-sigma F factor antagonist)
VAHGERFGWVIRDGVAVVSPPSELDLSNADRLRECCRAAIVAAGSRLVVDLAEITFMDSSALNVFVRLAKQLKADGGWLRLASGGSSVVQRLLNVTGLEASLGNYRSVEEAIGA